MVHPWGFGFTGTREEIANKINSLGDLEGGFNSELRSCLKFLLYANDEKKQLKFHAAGHEGHLVLNLEEIPVEDLEQMKQKEIKIEK